MTENKSYSVNLYAYTNGHKELTAIISLYEHNHATGSLEDTATDVTGASDLIYDKIQQDILDSGMDLGEWDDVLDLWHHEDLALTPQQILDRYQDLTYWADEIRETIVSQDREEDLRNEA